MKNKPLNILSCFDGMSCLQIALKQLNLPIANYFASEVDKFSGNEAYSLDSFIVFSLRSLSITINLFKN
jgi:hypothetical protein